MADPGDPRWARTLLHACVFAWPRGERRTRRRELTQTALDLARDRSRPGSLSGREVVGEAAALAYAGLGRRWNNLMTAARQGRTGWFVDVRFAARALRGSPGFAAVALVTIALGIGANVAIFSLVEGVLFRPPPYERPDELVIVWNSVPGSEERIPVAGPDAAVVAERSQRLDDVAFTIRGVDGFVEDGTGEGAQHARIAAVTVNFFAVLGAAPALGRLYDERDGPGGSSGEPRPPSAILSHGAWRTRFAADPSIVGREIRLNGLPTTVVGVMPPDFRLALPPDVGLATDVDVWVPLSVPLSSFHRTDGRLLDQDSDNTGALVARLADGATIEQAQMELDRIAADLRAEVPAYAVAGLGLDVRSLAGDATAHARPILMALLAGVAGVLLVACLNIATLILARSLTRAREFAVRSTLGAGRVRLVRQLLVEGGVLVALGLCAAIVLAFGALPMLVRWIPDALAPADPVTLDVPTLAFAAALAGGAALLFGLAPAAQAALRETRGGLGSGVIRGAASRSRGRSGLVAAQVALSLTLMLCAGLLLRTVEALQAVRPGFQPEGALTFHLSLRAPDKYRSPAYRAELMSEIGRRLEALPGVRAVGLVGVLPLAGDRWTQPYGLPGQPQSEWRENRADFRVITSGAFDALGARLVEGRAFSAHEDLNEDERVVIIDEKLATRVAPSGSALGASIGIPLDGAPVEARVVGVVEHIRYERLDADGREAVYVPYRQEASRDVAFVVRTDGDPGVLASDVRRAVRTTDPQIPVYDLSTLDAYVARAVAPRRFALTLLIAFAGLALLCAAVGLYGVVAFDVGRRTRDIGLRMAVGATRDTVVYGVLASGLRLGSTGVAGGLLLSIPVVRALGDLLYGVGTADPATWLTVVLLVFATTLAATWLPARAASRLSPTAALRID